MQATTDEIPDERRPMTDSEGARPRQLAETQDSTPTPRSHESVRQLRGLPSTTPSTTGWEGVPPPSKIGLLDQPVHGEDHGSHLSRCVVEPDVSS